MEISQNTISISDNTAQREEALFDMEVTTATEVPAPKNANSPVNAGNVLLKKEDIEKGSLTLHQLNNVNVVDDEGNTPLMIAAKIGDCASARHLLSSPSIDVKAKNKYGETAFFLAAKNGQYWILKNFISSKHKEKLVLAQMNERNLQKTTPLIAAIQNGDTLVISLILNLPSIDVNGVDSIGFTPLLAAVHRGSTEIVQLLLESPSIDVTIKDYYGCTAVFHATSFNHFWTLHYMLYSRFYHPPRAPHTQLANQINMPCIHIRPLEKAAIFGCFEAMRVLLNTPEIDARILDSYKFTPLMIATLAGKGEVVQRLLAQSADVTARDFRGRTALFFATCLRELGIAMELLNTPRGRQNVNTPDYRGATPLHAAASHGDLGFVKLLLSIPETDAYAKDFRGQTALMRVAFERPALFAELIKVLAEKAPASYETTDYSGMIS